MALKTETNLKEVSEQTEQLKALPDGKLNTQNLAFPKSEVINRPAGMWPGSPTGTSPKPNRFQQPPTTIVQVTAKPAQQNFVGQIT